MDGIGAVWSLLAPYIGFIVIGSAAFAYLMAQYYQRKIFPRVEYHRKGPNAETYQCVELGNRVMFTTGGGFRLFGAKRASETIAAVIMAHPEIKVFGFKTIRLHHVVEGFNQTIDVRDVIEKINPIGGGAVSVCEAVMATSFENMAKSIPKGRTEWMMMAIIGFMGFGWGMLIGALFV